MNTKTLLNISFSLFSFQSLKLPTIIILLLNAFFLLSTSNLHAGDLELEDGLFSDSWKITGGPETPGLHGTLEVESPAGSGIFEKVPEASSSESIDLGFFGSGSGTFNDDKLDHKKCYRVCFNGPLGTTYCPESGGVKPCKSAFSWFGSDDYELSGGIQPLTPELFYDNPFNSMEFIESWENESIWSLKVNTDQAMWVPLGEPLVVDNEGDLVATVLEITDSEIIFQIIEDPSPFTQNALRIENVGLDLQPNLCTIDFQVGVQGNINHYVDGELFNSAFFSSTYYSQVFSLSGGESSAGCLDPEADNYNSSASCDDNSCEYLNCNNPIACNYNPEHANDLGCVFDGFVLNVSGSNYNNEIKWQIFNSNNLLIDQGFANVDGTQSIKNICHSNDCFNLVISDETGYGWPGGSFDISDLEGNVIYSGNFATGNGYDGYTSVHLIEHGSSLCNSCQDTNACNYDPSGVYSNSDLCEYASCAGCTYSFASNYNPSASLEDGSCLAPVNCPGDADGSGSVNVLDLVAVSSSFGNTCP